MLGKLVQGLVSIPFYPKGIQWGWSQETQILSLQAWLQHLKTYQFSEVQSYSGRAFCFLPQSGKHTTVKNRDAKAYSKRVVVGQICPTNEFILNFILFV